MNELFLRRLYGARQVLPLPLRRLVIMRRAHFGLRSVKTALRGYNADSSLDFLARRVMLPRTPSIAIPAVSGSAHAVMPSLSAPSRRGDYAYQNWFATSRFKISFRPWGAAGLSYYLFIVKFPGVVPDPFPRLRSDPLSFSRGSRRASLGERFDSQVDHMSGKRKSPRRRGLFRG